MQPPPGLVWPTHHVHQLKCTLYGPKQALRAWIDCFNTCVLSLGFKQSDHDNTLFTFNSYFGCVFLLLYVDNRLLPAAIPGVFKTLRDFYITNLK